MAPNPVVIPRHRASSQARSHPNRSRASWTLSVILVLASSVAAAVIPREWMRSWISSGAAPTSILLCLLSYRSLSPQHSHTWLLLTALNLAFAIAHTSWLLFPLYVTATYLTTFWVSLLVFPAASSIFRGILRRLCPGVYFFKDKLAFGSIPALQIDTEVNGLFVIRGLSLSLLDLTLEAHGLELGVRLNRDVELALCADCLTVRLFRGIRLSDVYGNLKVDEQEMFFEAPGDTGVCSNETSKKYPTRLLTNMVNSSFRQPTNNKVETQHADADTDESDQYSNKSQNDIGSEQSCKQFLKRIERSSQIHRARSQIEHAERAQPPGNEREMRQAVCAKLQDVPSISHTPRQAVKVSVLQTIFPRLRRFLHRLPLVLRLILNPLSNLHPIDIASVSIAGPGEKLKEFLESYVLQTMAKEAQDADMEQFQEDMSKWLSGASFCLEVADLKALAYVPLTLAGEITTYMRSGNVSMYRTPLDSNAVTQVTHIGGADATCVLPGYLLPHHEHCLPPLPTKSPDKNHDSSNLSKSDANHDKESDETEITVSVHASLPTHFDQSLLDFAAVLLKATKLIDLENLFERESASNKSSNEQSNSTTRNEDTNSEAEHMTQDSDTRNGGSNLSKRLASRAYHSVKDGVKKGTMIDVASNKVNDRWVMKTVSRVAEKLEHAQGDFGYTKNIPISLKPYREAGESNSKILP